MEAIRYRLWKNRKKLLVAAALVLLFFVDRTESYHHLTGVCEAVRSGEYIYLVDDKDDSNTILRIDEKGVIYGKIKLPKLTGDWWHSYYNFSADDDGTIYVYRYSRTMDRGMTTYQVLSCDFDAGRLTPVWDLPGGNLQIQVRGQSVYYVAEKPDGSAGFYRQDKDDIKTLLLSVPVTTDQIKLFCWNPDGGFLWVDWSGRFYHNEVLLTDGFDHPWEYTNISTDDQGIFYTDMETGNAMRVGWEVQKPEFLFAAGDRAGIYPVHHDQDGSFIAAIDLSAERRGLVMFDDQGQETGRWSVLVEPAYERIINLVKVVCLIVVAAAAVMILKRLLFHFTDGVMPILLQLLGVVLPVIVLTNIWIDRDITKTLEERMLKMQYDLLYVIMENQLSRWDPDRLAGIDWHNIDHDLVYQEIFHGADYSHIENTIYPGGSDMGEAIISNPYAFVYLLKDDELRYLKADGRQFYGTRVLYDRGWTEVNKMTEAMQQQRVISSVYSDLRGRYIVLYAPIISAEGEAIGVVECGTNHRILTYEVRRQMNQVRHILTGVLIVLAGGIALVLGYGLKPLGVLREAVEKAGKGHLGETVAVRGSNEISRIAGSFNQMSEQLKVQMDYIAECSRRYATFVPRQVFEILGRADITEAELGDQSQIQAAVLDVQSSQFQQMARKLDGDSLYGMVNHMLETMIEIVNDGAGIVDHMAGNSLLAYYPDAARSSLVAAVSICETLNRQMKDGADIPLYRMVIHYGSIRVGIIGEESRMAAGTISEAMTLVSFLRDIGDRYHIRILVTESLKQQIFDFSERFHSRMIGYLHFSMTDSLEAVYDVYDGDQEEERRLKAAGRELFDRALQDYLAGRYYDARLKFAGVLRSNPGDMVAREYIYRCDGYYQADGKKDLEIWLEQY